MKTNLSKMTLALLLVIGVALLGCKKDDPLSNLTGLTKFGFNADPKIPGLENIEFTIDQLSGTITNANVLPYKAEIGRAHV